MQLTCKTSTSVRGQAKFAFGMEVTRVGYEAYDRKWADIDIRLLEVNGPGEFSGSVRLYTGGMLHFPEINLNFGDGGAIVGGSVLTWADGFRVEQVLTNDADLEDDWDGGDEQAVWNEGADFDDEDDAEEDVFASQAQSLIAFE